MIYGILLIYRFSTGLLHSDTIAHNDFLNISSVFQMMDLTFSINCVFFGFVKRHPWVDYSFIWWECKLLCIFCGECCSDNCLCMDNDFDDDTTINDTSNNTFKNIINITKDHKNTDEYKTPILQAKTSDNNNMGATITELPGTPITPDIHKQILITDTNQDHL